jgi:GntR family transcriptional regulator, transcriptional repressor for pyruvate dehydrogenase complex
MPIQIIEPQRLYRQIADQLRELIRYEELKPGTKLPTERDLAIQLGVSRPSVREALIALEVEGCIEIRKGAGIYISQRRAERAVHSDLLTDMHGPLELIRARAVVEGEIAALAARVAKKQQLALLDEALEMMRNTIRSGGVPMEGDRLFHLRLSEIAGNGALTSIVALLFDQRNSPISTKLGQHLENTASWNAAVAEHQQVATAVANNDPTAARAAMHRHMDRSHRRLTKRLD